MNIPDLPPQPPRRPQTYNAGGPNELPDFKLPPMPRLPSGWLIGLPLLFALLLLKSAFVLVGAGERAVIFNRFAGTQAYQLGEGLHFVVPGVQLPTIYDVKSQTYTMSGSNTEANPTIGNANDALQALTRDGLPVILEMSVRFHIDPERVWKLHQSIGPAYIEKIVRPQTRSHVRMVISQYPVVSVYGAGRAKIIEQINARLRRLFSENDIILDEALLRDVGFSPQFQAAIEKKQVAQQEVARMEFVLQQAQKEAERKVIEAEGEAKSIEFKANALARNPGLTQYEYVQRLPDNVRTVVTDGRTIINLGDTGVTAPAVAAEAAEPQQAPAPQAPTEQAPGEPQ